MSVKVSNAIKALVDNHNGTLHDLGIEVGRFYTDKGLPIDMALSKLDMSSEQKVSVLDGALWWLVEHKRRSGASEEALNRQRRANVNYMSSYLEKGEVGAY